MTHAPRPARSRRVFGAGALVAKALLLPLLLSPGLARAEVPDGYTLVFQSGFNPGVSIAGGNGCGDTRRLTGVDSVTGYSWEDLPGDPSANYFNDVIVDGSPDCCPQGCAATSKDECHTLDIVSGLPQYDGSVGYGLRGVLLQDCSTSSYSRIQYNMYDADPPVGDPLEDLAAYYAEIDVILPNPEVVTQLNGWLGILENYDTDNYAWKSALVLDCISGGTCPQFYMYNCRWQVDCTLVQDNAIAPQAGVPFKLRIWYRASTTDGLFKITYTCPGCTPPVSETTIGEFTGQTIDEGDLDVADIIKVSGTWGGVEMDWTEFTLAAPSPGSGGAGAAAVGGAGGNGGSGAGGSGGSGTGAQAGAASAPTAEDDGGCGCRLTGGRERQGWIGFVALVCLGALRRQPGRAGTAGLRLPAR